jgi:hypothetical protein
VKRFAAVRFVGALAANEREAVSRSLGSFGASATSWNVAAGHTYASIESTSIAFGDGSLRERLRLAHPSAELSVPPVTVLRVRAGRAAARLAHALAGPGRPLGIVASFADDDALVVEIDVRITPLSTIMAAIDAATPGEPPRIDAILPLDDEPLAEIAGALLGDPAIDATRLIETWLEPLLARTPS